MIETNVLDRVHVPDTYDVPHTNDSNTDDGPCEDIIVLAKIRSGASEDKAY